MLFHPPISFSPPPSHPLFSRVDNLRRTSFLVTGLSSKLRCVSLPKCRSVSRSASSARVFCVRIRHVRFGIEVASVGWMLVMRLRARRRVCRRGERGKLERVAMSLSVKSMASWSCSQAARSAQLSLLFQYLSNCLIEEKGRGGGNWWNIYFGNAQILNRWDLVTCGPQDMISMELASKCSICSFQLGDAPLRSSSRSLRGLR